MNEERRIFFEEKLRPLLDSEKILIKKADKAIKEGLIEEAILFLKGVLLINPASQKGKEKLCHLYFDKARKLIEDNRYDESEYFVSLALELNPNNFKTNSFLSQIKHEKAEAEPADSPYIENLESDLKEEIKSVDPLKVISTNLKKLTTLISKSFIERYHPEELDNFREYLNFWVPTFSKESPPRYAERFEPTDAIQWFIPPLVVSIVEHFLRQLIDKSTPPLKEREYQKKKIEERRNGALNYLDFQKEIPEPLTKKQKLIEVILLYTISYLETYYE